VHHPTESHRAANSNATIAFSSSPSVQPATWSHALHQAFHESIGTGPIAVGCPAGDMNAYSVSVSNPWAYLTGQMQSAWSQFSAAYMVPRNQPHNPFPYYGYYPLAPSGGWGPPAGYGTYYACMDTYRLPATTANRASMRELPNTPGNLVSEIPATYRDACVFDIASDVLTNDDALCSSINVPDLEGSSVLSEVDRAVHDMLASLDYFSIVLMSMPSPPRWMEKGHKPMPRLLGIFAVHGLTTSEAPAHDPAAILLWIELSRESEDAAVVAKRVETRLCKTGINIDGKVACVAGTDVPLLSLLASSLGVPSAPAIPSVAEAVGESALTRLKALHQARVCSPVLDCISILGSPAAPHVATSSCNLSAAAAATLPAYGEQASPATALHSSTVAMGLLLSLHAVLGEHVDTAAGGPTASSTRQLQAVLRAQSWQVRVEACVFYLLTRDLVPLVRAAVDGRDRANTINDAQDSLTNAILALQAYRAMLSHPRCAEQLTQRAIALAQDAFGCGPADQSVVPAASQSLHATIRESAAEILGFLQRVTGYAPAVLLSDPRVCPALVAPLPSRPSPAAVQRTLRCSRVEAHMHGPALLNELQEYQRDWDAFAALGATECNRDFAVARTLACRLWRDVTVKLHFHIPLYIDSLYRYLTEYSHRVWTRTRRRYRTALTCTRMPMAG
jgi:hypothetical protein